MEPQAVGAVPRAGLGWAGQGRQPVVPAELNSPLWELLPPFCSPGWTLPPPPRGAGHPGAAGLHTLCTSFTTRSNHKPPAALDLWLSFQKCSGVQLTELCRIPTQLCEDYLQATDCSVWQDLAFFTLQLWRKMGPEFQKEKNVSSKKTRLKFGILKKTNELNVQHGMGLA